MSGSGHYDAERILTGNIGRARPRDMVHRVYLEGAGFAAIVHDLWPQLLLAAVALPAASWMFRHRLTSGVGSVFVDLPARRATTLFAISAPMTSAAPTNSIG
jgi:hypothetical protein